MKKILISLIFSLIFINIKAQCPNDNVFYTSSNLICPSSITIPCVFGGEYVTLNIVAGNTYTFSTCNGAFWDTQITLYNNIGVSVGYNDDFCGLQSQITWTATYTGILNVLIDQYFCMSNFSCADLTISCCSTNNPSPSDCMGAITICSNATFNNNANNIGCTQDLNITNRGCLVSGERQGTWYIFSPINTGTLAFTINPSNPLDDYDFALWGPFPQGTTVFNICSPLGPPLRCSYSALGGSTGLDFISLDVSEGAGGDKWVQYLNVTVGDVYLMYIDNFSQSGLAFNLVWNPANTASLNCTSLPIEFINFKGEIKQDYNYLYWVFWEGNDNISTYYLERSQDLINWEVINNQNTRRGNNVHEYTFKDKFFKNGVNYYRIRYDFVNYTNIISLINDNVKPWKKTNMLGQEVDDNYKGIVIEYYNNYTIKTNQ